MTNQLTLTAPETFPSMTHLQHLRQHLKNSGGSLQAAFIEHERWQFHAYDYAWRFVWLEDSNHRSPIDKDGKWWKKEFMEAALQIFVRPRTKPEMRRESSEEIKARGDRETWAREHGCESFRQAMEIGLQAVGRRSQVS